MKSQAIGNRIPSNVFDFTGVNGTFSVDMSEVSHAGFDPLKMLSYPDGAAFGKGFVMESSKTGAEVEFVLYHTDREADNDVRFWYFKPTAQSIAKNAKLTFIKAIIYNT